MVLTLITIAFTPTSEAQQEPYISEVMYSKDNAESLTIVQSGRDNATYYKYLIILTMKVFYVFFTIIKRAKESMIRIIFLDVIPFIF